MGSILKALGLTIWGLIGFGLLAIFIFVGYEAALKYRASSGSIVNESADERSIQTVTARPIRRYRRDSTGGSNA